MHRKRKVDRTFLMRLGWVFLGIALLGGCAAPKTGGPPVAAPPVTAPPVEPRVSPNFVAITAQEGDTFSSLAARYLNDSLKDWWISDFNNLSALNPGQALIIPLKPYGRGGLTATGYQTVPVLSYHTFALTGADKMTVTQAAFEEQMKLLKEKGYRVISLNQFADFLEFKKPIPKKSVVITIDDGWRSAYEIAFPILKKYGYPATLFVYTDLIVGNKKTLSWDLIQEMANQGLDIQGHMKSHRNLTVMEKKESFKEYFEAIDRELTLSGSIIRNKVNREVKYLAYPYGETNHLAIELIKKHGYQGAFTVTRGGNSFFVHPYRINRSMIYGTLDLNQFEKNLTVFSEWAGK